MEYLKLDASTDYNLIENLALEARQKLNQIKPLNIGQASRISGVSPADISVLLIYIETMKKQGEVVLEFEEFKSYFKEEIINSILNDLDELLQEEE